MSIPPPPVNNREVRRLTLQSLIERHPPAEVRRLTLQSLIHRRPPAEVRRLVIQTLKGPIDLTPEPEELERALPRLRMRQRDLGPRQKQVTSEQQSNRLHGNTYR